MRIVKEEEPEDYSPTEPEINEAAQWISLAMAAGPSHRPSSIYGISVLVDADRPNLAKRGHYGIQSPSLTDIESGRQKCT